MLIQQYQQAAQLAAYQATPTVTYTYVPAPTVTTVDVNVPNIPVPSGPPRYVTLRGPDGEVRRFPLARGVEVRYSSRHVVLHPGESTTIQLTPVP